VDHDVNPHGEGVLVDGAGEGVVDGRGDVPVPADPGGRGNIGDAQQGVGSLVLGRTAAAMSSDRLATNEYSIRKRSKSAVMK
jgi:hypothetical protein